MTRETSDDTAGADVMIVYVDSSAVLVMLLGEPSAVVVRRTLQAASRVVTSALTAVECTRALIHARRLGRISEMEQAVLEHLLNQAEAGWAVHALSDDILALARTEIPAEPVRTLDAIHIASALTLRDALGDLRVLSLDKRMRACVSALGVRVLPDEA